MPETKSMNDPTQPICEKAMTFPDVIKDMSCNQTSFKATKSKFLFIGPGPKGRGFKVMFKLDKSTPQARELAAKEPERYKMGSSAGWVTVRFTSESPIPKYEYKWTYPRCCFKSKLQ